MKDIKLNTIAYDNLIVNDEDGNLITGLVNGDFTKKLYNPSGSEVSSSITVTISELGNGLYRASFTPNATGAWTLLITNVTYFSFGKAADYRCVENFSDDLATVLDTILEYNSGRWKINQNTKEMIFYKSDNVTELGRFKLYDNTGQLNTENVFERRKV